jgi:hypothetical protein
MMSYKQWFELRRIRLLCQMNDPIIQQKDPTIILTEKLYSDIC